MASSDFESMDNLKQEPLFDINMKSVTGNTFLISAIYNGFSADVLNKLIEDGADMSLNDAGTRNAFQAAVNRKNHDAVKVLINQGWDLNSSKLGNKNDLRRLVKNLISTVDFEMIEYLIQHGRNFNINDISNTISLKCFEWLVFNSSS